MTDPEPEDPQTVGEHIRKFLADLRLAKQVEVRLQRPGGH